ncbi:unnamed protein product [Symbiodinium natans]|uniref:Uncharacterized protein n=1 Tax=Symbiodinium natans TaxID=878477 RepID=A0A812SMD1_9DINO|nr:unnamed protein product [Symbiodinium natans]
MTAMAVAAHSAFVTSYFPRAGAVARSVQKLAHGSRRLSAAAGVPRSARWLVKEASRQPAYSPDGRLRPGLNVLPPGQWLRTDEDDAEVVAMKRAALDDPQLGSSLSASDGKESTFAAEEELYSLVAAACEPADHPQKIQKGTLAAAARLIPEDLVLLRQNGEEPATMCSVCVCFSFGQLPAKLGAPLSDIHAPVPGYADSLRRPLDRIFAKLRPEKSFWRTNFEFRWTGDLLHPSASDDPSLKGDLSHAAGAAVDEAKMGPADMFLRVEYQTIRRLPESQHIAFTIRSYTDPLPLVAASPASAALARQVAGLSPDMAAYKGISKSMRPRIEAYLRSASGA